MGRTRKQYIVISYDISDSRRLQKIAKIMKNYTNRVLYSVFEGELTKDEEMSMRSKVQKILDPVDDSVRYYHLCDRCKGRIMTSGVRVALQHDSDFDIV